MNLTSFAKKAGIVLLFCFVIVAIFSATPASAYVPLAPSVPGTGGGDGSPGGFLSGLINFAIGFSGVLAVLVIVWGGVTYITAAGDTNKVAAGRERITSAILGLILILTSWLILNTINPELVQLDFTVRDVSTSGVTTTDPRGFCFGVLPEGETDVNTSELDIYCGFSTQQACQEDAAVWQGRGRNVAPCQVGPPSSDGSQPEPVEYCYAIAPEGETSINNAFREGDLTLQCGFEEKQACDEEVNSLRSEGRVVTRCNPEVYVRGLVEDVNENAQDN